MQTLTLWSMGPTFLSVIPQLFSFVSNQTLSAVFSFAKPSQQTQTKCLLFTEVRKLGGIATELSHLIGFRFFGNLPPCYLSDPLQFIQEECSPLQTYFPAHSLLSILTLNWPWTWATVLNLEQVSTHGHNLLSCYIFNFSHVMQWILL